MRTKMVKQFITLKNIVKYFKTFILHSILNEYNIILMPSLAKGLSFLGNFLICTCTAEMLVLLRSELKWNQMEQTEP